MKNALVRIAWVAVFVGLVFLTALAARELDRVLTLRTAALKAEAMRTLEDMAGRTISYGGVSPSFFRRLSIRDLVIHDSQDPHRPLITIHEVQVYYSLLQLLWGHDPLGAIQEVRLLNSQFTVDLQRDQDVVDLVQRLLRSGGAGGLRAQVTGEDIGLTVTSHGSRLDLRHLYFRVQAQEPSIGVSLRGDVAGQLPSGFHFASSLEAQGTLDRGLSASDLTVRLGSFSSSLVNAAAQTVQVVWRGERLEVRKIQDRSPVVLDLQADLARRDFTLDFQSQDLRLERLVSFSGRLAPLSSWLQVPVTSSGHVTWNPRTRRVDYAADLSAYIEDQLPIRGVALSATVRGSEREVFFAPLRLSSEQGTAQFEGSVLLDSLYPSGLLTMSHVRTAHGENISAQLSLERAGDGLRVHSTHLDIGDLGFDSLQLTLSPSPEGASFTMSTTFSGSAPENTLRASGDLRLGRALGKAMAEAGTGTLRTPAITVAASLRNVPPAKLYHLLVGAGALTLDQQDVYNLLSHYSVSTEATISTDFTRLSLAARSVTVTSTDDPNIGFHFGLALDKSHLSLTSFTGNWKGVGIQGGFDGDLGEGGQIGFASNLSFLGNSYFLTGRYSPTSGLVASGSYGLAVSAIPIRGGGALLKLKSDKLPVPVEHASLPVSVDVSGLVTPEGEWSADIQSMTVYEVPLPHLPHAFVQLSGRMTSRTLEIARLWVKAGPETFLGSAHASMVLPADLFDPNFLDVLDLQGAGSLRSLNGAEAYTLDGGLSKGTIAITAHFDSVPVQRVGITQLTGTLSGTAAASGTLAQPAVTVAVSLNQGRLGSDPFALDGRVQAQAGVIRVQGIRASYLAHKLTDGEGSIDLGKGTFAFHGRVQTEVFADDIRLELGLEGSYAVPGDRSAGGSGSPAGPASRPLPPGAGDQLDAQVSGLFRLGLQAKLSLSSITVAGSPFPAWGVAFRTTPGRIAFDGGPGNSIHGWLDPRMEFGASLLDPLPLSGTVLGRVDQGRIHAVLDVDHLDMQVLNPILKSPPVDMGGGARPAIQFTAGVGSGRLTANGVVNDPDIVGQLDIQGGRLLTAYSPVEAGPIRTSLVFEGKTFRITRAVASAGAAKLSAEASFTLDHWIPQTWAVDLATEDNTAVRIRTRFGVLNVDGAAAGSLRVTGDDRSTNISGTVTLADCRITLGQAPGGKFVPEEPPTIADVSVTTGRRVEFSWPSENLPVIRTIATPGGTVRVTYRGDTGAFTVKGATGIQGGEIYYFDRSFIMKRGSIVFNEDQSSFDPTISARAEAREWDQSTATEVRIYLDADGPLSKFSPRFSSDPPRTDTQILAMIGAPLVNRAESQGIGMAALVYSDILSQNWILRPFEQKVRQVLNLDMFSIRTQVIQNLAAERVLGPSVNPLDNTSVSIGKYIGNDLFLEMLVRLEQPTVPTAIVTPAGGLIAESFALRPDLELSLEWATPFFMMEWSFIPQHPETLFLSDNSLSFSWRFSY